MAFIGASALSGRDIGGPGRPCRWGEFGGRGGMSIRPTKGLGIGRTSVIRSHLDQTTKTAPYIGPGSHGVIKTPSFWGIGLIPTT